jgi:adenylate cyclase
VTDPSKAVFLSYASQDAEAARQLCNSLRAAGIEVWFDQSELRGGDSWDALIRRQIKGCYLFVPIISANTQAREEGYFRREWKLAVDRTNDMAEDRAFLLPILVDGTSDSEARVPEKFREVQWTRLPGGANADAFVKHVRRMLAPDPTTPAATNRRPSALPTSSTRVAPARSMPPALRSFVPWIVGGLLILAIGYYAADKFLVSKRAVPAAEATSTAPIQAAAVSDKSIAVLPFTDMSEKHDQEYFADGMAEEILDLLTKIPGLAVIGRTSSFAFKGKNDDLRTIGTKLNTAYVLEGSVRKSGDQVRITAQLINTKTGTHEWSETYDRHIGDVLKLQDAIAAAVVRELQLTVAFEDVNSRSTLKSADAYDLILRGRHAADRWDQEGLDEAVTLFEQALDRDATSADASAELAFAYESQGEEGYLAPATAFEQARRAAAAALKLDSKCALAHYVLGLIHLSYDWGWAAAKREFEQVAALAPGGARALIGEENLSLTFGRWDDALRQIKAALALDPLYVTSLYDLAEIQMRRGHLPEAEAAIRRGLDVRPTYDWGHWLLGLVLLARGDRDAALLEMQLVTSDDGRQSGLAIVYYALGRKADSDSALADLINGHADTSAFEIANVYAYRGEPDEAMHWLERAYAQKNPSLIYVKVEQPLKSLVGDPRYKAFLRKMNLPE